LASDLAQPLFMQFSGFVSHHFTVNIISSWCCNPTAHCIVVLLL